MRLGIAEIDQHAVAHIHRCVTNTVARFGGFVAAQGSIFVKS
jgi:hypothetical protein